MPTTMTLAEALKTDHPIINDIRTRSARYGGSLTERQAALVLKIASERSRPRGAAPTGARVVLEGEVVKLDSKLVGYGHRASYRNVMTVELDCGAKVWGTVPRGIDRGVSRGERVRFTADVTASDRDPSFGFFKRPTKAEILPGPSDEPAPGTPAYEKLRAMADEPGALQADEP